VTDQEARAAFPLEWGAVQAGVVPAWLAEMDFRLAPVVKETIVEAVRRGTAGYPSLGDGGVGPAFAGFAERDSAAVALEHGVRPAPGSNFQPGFEGHVRLDVATSPAPSTTMIERLASASTDDVA